MEPIYYLDFDDTLFDIKRFSDDFRKVLLLCGVTQTFIDTYYCKETPRPAGISKSYHLMTHPEELLYDQSINKEDLKNKLFNHIKQANKYVYPDALTFLKTKKKENVFIITYGDPSWQKLKIDNSTIRDYFQEYLVQEDGLKHHAIMYLQKKYSLKKRVSFFIDDRLKHINQIDLMGEKVHPIYINREVKRKETVPSHIPIITTFDELN